MTKYKIKTHKIGVEYDRPHFYILNKGQNSGRPMYDQCPNCFVCTFNNELDRDIMYWLIMGVFNTGIFRRYCTGSVIEFVRINDVKRIIEQAFVKYQDRQDECNKKIQILQIIEKETENIKNRLNIMQKIKRSVMQDIVS